jgi:hypothetical protein
MSRFAIKAQDGKEYVYGYDRPLQYYFLDLIGKKGFPRALVGMLSPIYGSAHNLLEMCNRLGIKLPRIHREELFLDLPFSEQGYEDNPPLTGPEYGDNPDDSLIEDPQSNADSFESSIDKWGAA